MKTLLMIIATTFFLMNASAQMASKENSRKTTNGKYDIESKDGKSVLTKDGSVVPGSVILNSNTEYTTTSNTVRFCVETISGKTVVMYHSDILTGYIMLQGGVKLTDDGNVIWSDSSRTVLKSGSCIDEQGTIYPPASGDRINQ